MFKYLRALSNIIINYRLFFVPILFYELYFYTFYNNKYNKFKYLDSNFLSDSIPCPYYFLKKIEKYIQEKDIKLICDLGSGYGKILYYFGKVCKRNIHGVELEKEIYLDSSKLVSQNIKIFNEDILMFDLNNSDYSAFILNDPLKNANDLLKLIFRIKKAFKNVDIILINLDIKKQMIVKKELNIIKNFVVSKNKNIFFCKIN